MALNSVKKIDSVFIIPNTYKLVFKLKDSTNIYYLDCTELIFLILIMKKKYLRMFVSLVK